MKTILTDCTEHLLNPHRYTNSPALEQSFLPTRPSGRFRNTPQYCVPQEEFMNQNSFDELGVSAPLTRALEKTNITQPTSIQSKVIPNILAGRDIAASAETGSGKTLAFLLPTIQLLKSPGAARALVLAPTRELAQQIEQTARTYGSAAKLRSVAVVGGESLTKQLAMLKQGADIIVATPGRLNDLIQRNAVSLNSIGMLILDEADRMLDMGFLPQVRRIVSKLPRARQTILLSATLSREVEQLSREMMSNPLRLEVGRANTVATLTQNIYSVLSHAKPPFLLKFLEQNPDGSFLVFTETKRNADQIARILTANRHAVATLHSDRSQSQRNAALAAFRVGRVKVLVATDVAARGIDIDGLSHVVNYDVPSTPENYLHRVGRTARAGRDGSALTLVSPEEEGAMASIERASSVEIKRSKLDGFSDGRTDRQISLGTEIGRLRGNSARSFSPRR
ncbi:MAG: hypothetical protein DMF61_18205 [Blastocatellia bacterium AA13]|nr:MAG: hypothetical protein DMF61_18205 [Blastocatellia bacterium AA13]